MNPILRNILAVIGGVLVGAMVMKHLTDLGLVVIPLPDGVDVSTPEGLREGMKLLTPAHFAVFFFGHAFGTLSGAFIAAKFAVSHHMKFGIGVGAFFLACGIAIVALCGGPLSFVAIDLLAYLPVGYLGGKLACGKSSQSG